MADDMSPLNRMENEPTNEERADRIDTVMQAYCLTLEGRDFDGDEDDVKDLLTDLMHFCNGWRSILKQISALPETITNMRVMRKPANRMRWVARHAAAFWKSPGPTHC